MTKRKLLMTTDVGIRLVERLSKIDAVSRFDRRDEPQSATLVHALTDMEKSFREILDTLLPRLVDEAADSDQIEDALLEIGEELRHIHYHLKDPEFFGYLFSPED